MPSKLVCRPTFAAIALSLLLSSLGFGQASQQHRIIRPVDNRSVVRLQGSLNPRARAEFDQGPTSPTLKMQRMTLFFQPTAEQQAALEQLLAEQQDPTSPNYHKWLTPEEFADRFGISSQDINTLSAWLSSQGFTVVQIAHSRTWIAFSGIAAQVNAAFQTSIHNYLENGKIHYAAATEPSIPAAFAGVVTGIGGLHDFGPHARILKAKPQLTSTLTGNHFMVPGDFGTIYDLPDYVNGVFQPGIDGTGQTIAVMGQSNLSTDSNPGRNGTPGVNGQQYDLVTFRNLAGLPALNSTNFQIVIVPPFGDPGVVATDADEANLDIEWAGATAPNANLIFVVENSGNGGTGAFGALEYTVDNATNTAVFPTKPNIISISYGECEAQVSATDKSALTTAAQQAATQGQTIVAPSGDSGAADCDSNVPATQGLAVDFPASIPTVTAVGGTAFSADSTNSANPSVATAYWASATNDTTPSALAYIPETSWNDTATTTPSISATGGGVSTFFAQPAWQTGLGMATGRNLPDISFAASPNSDGYLICSQSSCASGYRSAQLTYTFNVIGGTSAPTPSFAGVVALINQKLGTAQGNINNGPNGLYAQAASAPWAFHDITTGNNMVSCTTGTGCTSGSLGYSAGPGYDLVTGLGSLDVGVLLNALNNVSDFSVTPASPYNVTVTAGNSGTLSLSVLGTSGSNITFSCAPAAPLPSTTTCSATPVTASGSTAVSSTLTVNTASGYSATGGVNVTASNGSISHLVPVTVIVNGTNPDFSLASTNGSEAVVQGSSTTDTITVTAVNGFSGSVNLTCSGTTGLSCSLSPASVTPTQSSTLTVNASSSALTGSITITATYTPSSGPALTHTMQLLVSLSAPGPNFTLTSSVNSLTISSGQTGTATITVAPTNGFSGSVSLSCSLTTSLGATGCSLSPSVVGGGSGTSTLTINAVTLTGMLRGAPRPSSHRGGAYATFVFALGIVFTMRPERISRSARSLRALRNTLLGLLLLCVMLGAVSCGGGGSSSGPIPLSGVVTVTGTGTSTSGSIANSISIAVTIQ